MKTRGGKKSTKTAAEANEVAKTTTPKTQLAPESVNPPNVFILPAGLSTEVRIVTLRNPRYLNDSRYVVCPERGIYEFSKIAAPKTTPRSWLLSAVVEEDGEPLKKIVDSKGLNSEGYVTKDANLFIATAVDPLFLILPALCPLPGPKASDKKLFLSGEDYLDRLAEHSPHIRSFLRADSLKSRFESRMAAVSDTVYAGDETMYRLNEGKLFETILSKATKMAKNGLPSSMGEKLVRKALEQPTIISLIQEESTITEVDSVVASGAETPDTQTTVSTTTSFVSEASTAATSFSEATIEALESKPRSLQLINAPDGIAELLRLRTAFLYICSAYVTPHITSNLMKLLGTSSSIDFRPLDEHLAYLANLRQDALAARSMGDYSRKRGLDDDEGEEKRAEKRRKEEEEKKSKANVSRGVKALKKVNVSGMKKMSDFFKKK